jgi:hypothetical protein
MIKFLLTIAIIFARNPRNYTLNSYVIVQSNHNDINLIAQESNAKVLGSMEMLQDHYILEIPKTLLSKKSISHPKAKFWEHQVFYKHLYKRQESGDILAIRNQLELRDPGFTKQWHLFNQETPHFDLNLTRVWAQNITGYGVTVGFIDDGIDHENPDLKDNFVCVWFNNSLWRGLGIIILTKNCRHLHKVMIPMERGVQVKVLLVSLILGIPSLNT